jgi:hypothetical protein
VHDRAFAALVAGLAFFTPFQTGAEPGHAFADRPDAHAPIGVMADHAHARGEWMLSYRYAHMRMKGNRSSTKSRSKSRVLESFPVTPTDMDVDVHMWGLMFAPTDRVTLMAMVPFLDKEMDHERRDGVEFETSSSGVGDLRLGGQLKLWHDDMHTLLLNAGLSLPTGAINEKDTLPAPAGRQRLPYPMQIGSGSVDFIPGFTYFGHSERWSWGAQALGTIRSGENWRDYRLGNRVDTTGWVAKPITKWLSLSARAQWMWWDNYHGADPDLNPALVPTADTDRRGGHRLDLMGGLNFMLPLGRGIDRYSHRIAIEAGGPAYQWLDGPQLETDWRIMVGWQKAFRPFSLSPLF